MHVTYTSNMDDNIKILTKFGVNNKKLCSSAQLSLIVKANLLLYSRKATCFVCGNKNLFQVTKQRYVWLRRHSGCYASIWFLNIWNSMAWTGLIWLRI